MEFLPTLIAQYSEEHTTQEPDYLKELVRETHLKVLMPRMLSGHLQGRFLSMISHMLAPKRVLEIGTYTGYSALCLAEGLPPDGKIVTLDINEELEGIVTKYIQKGGFEGKIEYKTGNALEIIPTLQEVWDLVFIDADKINYLEYYHLVFDQVRSDGWIIADNVLWSGKIVEEVKTNDKDTNALLKFNKFVQEDPRVENILLPIRDGLMIARKK
ncbi:MAG: class I SAM-dependent methyltransferase [Raineya sp.]|jgi:predicted O-methyltransferase YrrM|nr:class I SAM-dependent methyltransferase [Raineya sp.]